MRCKDNPLCSETKPCDNCDIIVRSLKKDLNAKYLEKLRSNKNNNEPLQNEEPSSQQSTNSQKVSKGSAIDTLDQGLRMTRLRKKGIQKFI